MDTNEIWVVLNRILDILVANRDMYIRVVVELDRVGVALDKFIVSSKS